MNREEILGMEAGRELDKLIHQVIFNGKRNLMVSGCYSTDIEAAWEVVEKMRRKDWRIDILMYSDGESVVNILDVRGCFVDSALSLSTPEAICKAALLAVMEEKSDGGGGE